MDAIVARLRAVSAGRSFLWASSGGASLLVEITADTDVGGVTNELAAFERAHPEGARFVFWNGSFVAMPGDAEEASWLSEIRVRDLRWEQANEYAEAAQ